MLSNNHDRVLLNSPRSTAFFALPEPRNFIIIIKLYPYKIRVVFLTRARIVGRAVLVIK